MNPIRARLAARIVLACWAATLPAAAQSDPAGSPVSELSRKAASKLLLTQIKPEYPPLARMNFIHGQVRVEVSVAPSGRVRSAHVVYGHPFLAASALEAISRWVYRPLTTSGGPAGFRTVVDVNFALRFTKAENLPPQAERDLTRQVRPPEVVSAPADSPSGRRVRLRVLVGEAGQPLDATPLGGVGGAFAAALRKIEGWKFRPARWGNLDVPWYVEVDVPVEEHRPADRERETPTANDAASPISG